MSVNLEQVKARVKERLLDGSMTREQATQVLQAAAKQAQTPAPDALKAKRTAADNAEAEQQKALKELAEEQSLFDSFLIGAGKGFYDIGRGIGLIDRADDTEKAAFEALKEQNPYTTGAGEIVGQAAPFIVPGTAIGSVGSLGGRVALGGLLGGTEGGIIANADDTDIKSGAGVGAAVGAGMEALFPIVGRLARAVYGKVTGNAPRGAMFTPDGQPTPELQQALDQAGMTMDDLTADARQMLEQAVPGTDPNQLARAAQFTQENVPITRGELTADAKQQTIENQLFESAQDPLAEQFRQFKLKQSEAIRTALERGINVDQVSEETGELIKDALSNRKNLLRAQKNELYRQALTAADDAAGLPIMVNADSFMPDARTLRGLDRASNGAATNVIETLAEYGIAPPTPRQLADPDFSPTVLSIENFEEVNQILKGIARSDQSGAVGRLVQNATEAIDDEVDNLAASAQGLGLSESVIKPLAEARSIVREIKTEFNPKAIAGKFIDNMKNSDVPTVQASQIYNKISSKSQPVENVRRLMDNLRRAGDDGQKAIGSLQATTMLDLIDAGFGTKSRKVSGVQTFNPIAFRNRLENLGEDKLEAIFKDQPAIMSRLRNIDKIAETLTSPAYTQPKGSASVLLDTLNRLGIIAISSKVPGVSAFLEQITRLQEAGASRQAMRRAMDSNPEVREIAYYFDRSMPNIASALGISGISELPETEQETQQQEATQ